MSESGRCCEGCQHGGGPVQSLDEMEWERGIWGAAQGGDYDRVERLLLSGKAGVNDRDSSGYTALHYAARNGHQSLCQLLIDSGAHVDAVTRQGQATALHRASSTGKEGIVRLLLMSKADPSMQDADGKNALHRAAEGQHESVCEILLGSSPMLCNAVDNRGQMPFHYARLETLAKRLKPDDSSIM